MSCVNTKSIEFKRLLEETNMSSSMLELLIHKIWNSEGSERIPTAEEITNLIKPKEFSEDPNIVELWDKYYSKPISFANVSSAYETYEKACIFFGEDSVSIIERRDGTFDIVVGNPTLKAEADYILSKAKRDSEGHLLAPNGQISHLSEAQYVQVRTKAFKDWFGDWEKDPNNASKVVDENGEPLMMYHTGGTDIDIFRTTDIKATELDPSKYTEESRVSLIDTLENEQNYIITEQQKEDFIKNGKTIIIYRGAAIYTTNSKEMSSSYGSTKKSAHTSFEYNRAKKVIDLRNTRNKLLKFLYQSADSYAEGSLLFTPTELERNLGDEYIKYLETHPEESRSSVKKVFEQLIDEKYNQDTKKVREELNPIVFTEDNANDIVGQYQLFVNNKNPLIVDAEGNNWNMIPYNGKIETTRSLEGYARRNGYTGIIVKNVYDYGGKSFTYTSMTPNTVVAVFKANQVKSVDNNGDFSSKNDDIYFENENSNSENYSEHEFTTDNPGKDTRLQKLYSKSLKENVTISDLYNLLKGSEYQDILNILSKLSKGKGYFLGDIKVVVEDPTMMYNSITKTYSNTRYKNRRAYYDAATKTIYINVNAEYTNGNANSVIMHEIMHALTVDRILNNDNLKQEFLKLINEYRKAFPREYWDLTDEHFIEEFIADVWSKKSTIEKLKKLQYKGDKHKSSLWDKIVNFFKSVLFKGAIKDSMFEHASNLLVDLLNQDITIQNKETFYENETSANKSLEDYYIFNTDIEYSSKKDLNGSLGRTRQGKITIATDVTVDDFFNYIKGVENSATSKQKAKVFELLNTEYGYTEEYLRNLIETNEDAQKLILYHELSHKYWEDNPKEYYKGDERDSSGKLIKVDYLAPNKIEIELRATVDAIRRLEKEKSEQLSSSAKENESKDQESSTITEENKSFTKKMTTVTQQINNLTETTILSSTETRHIAEQAVWWISDHITELQETPGLAAQIYGEQYKDKDLSSMSRIDIVKLIGPDNIITMCKEKFSPENTDYEDFSTIEKADVITDNWEAIILLANDEFLNLEEFSITSTKDGKTREVIEDIAPDVDNYNYSNEEDDILEKEGNLQEHWQIETKTLDVIATMSQLVKKALRQCYVLDNNGNKVTSEFGINERISMRTATNSILRWTQGALTLKQMIGKLQEKEQNNPWVKQLIDRLSDTSGKEADFQSQFFSTFSKHFQTYSIVVKENGKYVSKIVNVDSALKEAMTQVTTQFKINEHPLFTSEGINKKTFNELKNAFEELKQYKSKSTNKDITEEANKKEAAETLGFISNLLGYYITPEIVAENLNKDNFNKMYSALTYIIRNLENNLDNKTYEPFTFKAEGSIIGNTREFLRPITEYFENNTVAAFYDSGKMYQSYITPSYTTKLFQKFGLSGKAFDDFITKEYCCTEWFHTGDDIEKGWKNEWLRELVTSSDARQLFKHKVQLNFNKHNYMKNMNDTEYLLSIITEYFSEFSKENQSRVPAWFRVPMLSNKPSSEFIRFYSERGFNYKDTLVDKFKMIFDQELSRIQTVELRNKSKKDFGFIKNFDTNGRKFNFLDFMNEYLTGDKANSELGKLIRQKLNGLEIDEVQLNKLAKEAIKNGMESRVNKVLQEWKSQGVLEASKSISGIGNTPEEIRANIENFIWNDAFASMNIMQLTITDIAFYKDAEDLQKRLAQIHAPGIRANKDATDYKGNKVSDGYFRTAKLTDFDTFISNIIDNVSVVFDRKIESASESQKKALIALKESLVGKEGAFRQINVADAQGYSSPTSYRKKAFAFGKWSKKAEEIYKKLKDGTYTFSDLQIAFQPLKPFVYSQIEKSSGVSEAPIETFKIPIQFKNSEYLLIMADALLSRENTGKPNLLRAIYEVMENSHFDENGNYKTDGIDTIQFESTTKSGLSGKIELNDLVNNPNGEALAKARLEAAIYETTEREITVINPKTGKEETKVIYEKTGNYNNVAVDTVPFEDYCLQQEIPEHFKNHEQIFGSQSRFLLISELETLNYKGEPTYYKIDDKKKKITAQELKAEYEELNAANIQEKIEEVIQEFSLDKVENVKDRNIALSKILQREILSSPRYGIDLLQACSVDENGKFRIPLGDPIQSKRVEQLINSIIKNRINKQTMPGGPVVQVSNFGTSKELNIRFKDKDGKLLMTRAEYEKNPIKKIPTQTDKFNARYKKQQSPKEEILSYEDYIKEYQAGIAYFEVFAPIYTNDLFSMFADKNGVINVKAIEMLDPDLLKMIGYRIPTEDKYSMAPLKIVGFLPREAGDGIMLPNDITLLTGSDFDIDKEYLMRKELKINKNKVSKSKLFSILYNDLINSQSKKLSLEMRNKISELVQEFLADPFDSSLLVDQKVADGFISMSKEAYNKMLQTYIQNAYSVVKPLEGREYRNNRILDIAYAILTHETSTDKILNPGGFDQQKKMGYLVTAYRLFGDQYSWESLKNMSISELKDLCNTNKNLSFIDTHIQFYKQNNAAGSLIGIFAVNRTAHAVLESSTPDGSASYYVDVDKACKLSKSFTVTGMEFGGVMPLDMRYDRNGQLIGKVLGSLVASAADAVKDPILNLMNINGETANILNTLVRIGMPFDNAALFLSQSVITDVLSDFYRESINGGISLTTTIQNKLNEISKTLQIDESSPLNTEELTKEELIKGLKLNSSDTIKYKTLKALLNFLNLSTALRMPTFATRFNSITSAVGPLIIDNLITEYKMRDLSLNSCIVDVEYDPVDINTIFMDHPILNQFKMGHSIANQLFGNMPANSKGFRNILDSCDPNMLNTFINDRKLLSNLSDFYQTYLVVKSGVINSKDLNYYITDFPKEFMSKNYKEQYKDNPFISAIRYNVDKEGRGVLQLNVTGLDTAQKELLSCGWIDLHKSNPELSLKLFKYCFFRAGIGFSPKTFMSLVPTYVKERIPGYTDTFRLLPSVNPYVLLDQFIRNNWDNNKLVPRRSVATTNLKNGHLEVSKESDVRSLKNITYFKMKVNGQDKLFSVVSNTTDTVEIAEIDPLGNNKNYIEINENSIETSLEKRNYKTKEETNQTSNENSEVSEEEVINTPTEVATDNITTDLSETALNDLLYKALVIEGKRTEEQARDYVKNYKLRSEKEKSYFEKQVKRFLESRFKILNIEYSEKTLDDIYKLMC